jgi:predicted dehydrogenase
MTTDHLTTRSVSLGIVGTGLAVKKLHWPALVQMPERFKIAAFANHTRPKAEEFAKMAGLSMDNYHANYEELVRRDDVEAVLISLPIPLLYPATLACLEAGKHVICEKPAGSNLDQGREFLALTAQFPDLKVLVAENFFYRDDLRLARSLLDDGVIGRLHLVTSRVITQLIPTPDQFSSTPWRQAPRYRGGPHLDAGVHHIAQLRMLAGDVQSLHAFIQYANPTMGGPSDLTLNLHFVNDAVGSYVAGYLPGPSPAECNDVRLYGSEGVMKITRNDVQVTRGDGATVAYDVENADGGYYNEFLNFHDAIVHDEPIVGTIEQSYHNLLVILRGLDSAEEARSIAIDAPPTGLAALSVPLWRPRGTSELFHGLPARITERTGRSESDSE